MENHIIKVRNLQVEDVRNGDIIIKDLSFDVDDNECLAIVGESGSGKSMAVKSILGLHKPWIKCTGEIIFLGKNILKMSPKELSKIRGREIFMIFQDGMSAFDPSKNIESIFIEILMENGFESKNKAKISMLDSLTKVCLNNPALIIHKFPHQLSGGMLQRIMIAIAISLQPKIIIADEPTTALDIITQYEIVKEFINLKENFNNTMIFISHDLGIVKKLANRVMLMKNGIKVEEGANKDIFENPQSDYAKSLINLRTALGGKYKNLFGDDINVGCNECE